MSSVNWKITKIANSLTQRSPLIPYDISCGFMHAEKLCRSNLETFDLVDVLVYGDKNSWKSERISAHFG